MFFAVSVFMLAASQAEACSYAPLLVCGGLSAEQRAELAKDQQLLGKLREDMNTVCTNGKGARVNTCMLNKGACDALSYEEKEKFQYDFGADGSLKGMISPEERTKNAEMIQRIYDKWKS